MKKLTKVALSLLVAGSALGFSAFKSNGETQKAKLAPIYYGLDSADDVYKRISGTPVFENCTPGAPSDCVLVSPTIDYGPDLDANEAALLLPAEESSTEAYYFN
ncbi:MAG: hypothetical protein EOP48_28500 [Sphingobacteriales bacterium]|nr:MAG: hypothetical protein EOP48_28500 [Sphingobacteriales bacterium]